MDNPQKQQVAERVKQANNILVTVSNNPSVDQFAACIGLTLALNKLNKHATAVFSGVVPNTIEFLQPEKTIEQNTDSLRDFIIALDKAKADKLRYKVEDKVVKIFITPYRTSINEKDLQFGQGDFNVDVVVAIGVHNQHELDQAITAHGRILHDATVITMNVKPGGELGGINWLDQRASSLSELVVQLIDTVDKKVVDSQIATALLTGIVAETKRFSNDKTSPLTMSFSAELMAAGANQQLVATKLEPKPPPPPPPPPPPAPAPQAPPNQSAPAAPPPSTEGVLEIPHEKPLALQEEGEKEPLAPQIQIDQEGELKHVEEKQPEKPAEPPKAEEPKPAPEAPAAEPQPKTEEELKEKGSFDPTAHMASQRHILQPPSHDDGAKMMGALGADEGERPVDPLAAPGPTPLLRRDGEHDPTLNDIEKNVGSPRLTPPSVVPTDLSGLRGAVSQAANDQSVISPQPPIAALGAQPLGGGLHDDNSSQSQQTGDDQQGNGSMLPPPVPPPFTPPFGQQ